MASIISEASQRSWGRVAGLMYLFVLAMAVFGEFYVRSKLLVPGNPATTASNIVTNERLFRIGIAGELCAFSGIVVLALALFILLTPVNRNLALLALLWWLGEAVILGVAVLNNFIVLSLLGGADYLAAIGVDRAESLAMMFVMAYSDAYDVGMIFFSLGSAVFSYLLFESKYVPRAIAALGMFGSLAVLISTFVIIVYPGHETTMRPGIFVPIFFYELVLGAWLLLLGPKLEPTQRDVR